MILTPPYDESPQTALTAVTAHTMSLTQYGSMPPANLELDLLVQMTFAFIVAKLMLMMAKVFKRPLPALRIAAPVATPALCVEAALTLPVAEEALHIEAPVDVVEEALPVAAPVAEVAEVAAPVVEVALPVAVAEVAAPGRIRGRVPTLDKAYKHHFSKLGEVIPYGTKVFMKNSGEKRSAIFTAEGFKKGNYTFKSPNAWGVAFASRITEAHPWPTKPGVNSWHAIKVEDGPYAGKSIAEAYDLHFAH